MAQSIGGLGRVVRLTAVAFAVAAACGAQLGPDGTVQWSTAHAEAELEGHNVEICMKGVATAHGVIMEGGRGACHP